MSLSWIDHTVWLGRDQIALASAQRWAPSRAVSRDVQPVDAGHLALTLRQALSALPRGRLPTAVNMILGSPWVRYQVLPWQHGISTDMEWQNYGRAVMKQHFGGPTESWRIRVSEGAWGTPRLAAAIDNGLFEELTATVKAAKLTQGYFEPALMTVFNRFRKEIPRREFALLLLEGGQATCGFLSNGQWRAVITLNADYDSDLGNVLRQAAMLTEQVLPTRVYIASSEVRLAQLDIPDFTPHWLGGLHPLLPTLERRT